MVQNNLQKETPENSKKILTELERRVLNEIKKEKDYQENQLGQRQANGRFWEDKRRENRIREKRCFVQSFCVLLKIR